MSEKKKHKFLSKKTVIAAVAATLASGAAVANVNLSASDAQNLIKTKASFNTEYVILKPAQSINGLRLASHSSHSSHSSHASHASHSSHSSHYSSSSGTYDGGSSSSDDNSGDDGSSSSSGGSTKSTGSGY